MYKYLLTVLICVCLSNQKANCQTADSTVNQLLSIDSVLFLNRPLDSIIQVLPAGYTGMKIFGIRNTARFLRLLYPNKVWIELHVRQFNYMNPVDGNNTWNIVQMRKENLHSIKIYKGSVCYAGCPAY